MKTWKPIIYLLAYILFFSLLIWGCSLKPYYGRDNEPCDRNQYWSQNAGMCVAKPAG